MEFELRAEGVKNGTQTGDDSARKPTFILKSDRKLTPRQCSDFSFRFSCENMLMP